MLAKHSVSGAVLDTLQASGDIGPNLITVSLYQGASEFSNLVNKHLGLSHVLMTIFRCYKDENQGHQLPATSLRW